MRPVRTIGVLAAVSIAITLLLASCSGDDSESLTVYSGRNQDLVGPLLEQFTEETGIKIEFRGGDSGELAAQIITEGDASPADVFFSQDAGALGAVSKAGLFSTLPESVLDQVPEWAQSPDGHWVGVSGRVRVLAYDPVEVTTPPDQIDALLAPEWKGKIGYAPTNASWQSFVTGLRVLRGEDGAKAWLEAFADQDPKAYPNNITVLDGIEDGEVELGLVNHYYLYERIADRGEADVKVRNQFMAAGDAGGLVNVAGVGILASSEKQEQALRLVEFLLSPEAQEYFANETKEFPLVPGVEAEAELPALASLQPPAIDLSELDSIAATQELLEETGLLTR
ncbi:MAG TPA: iron ABC transporter substrate-binding protein [Acidimicrobiales bacterium]